MPAVHLQENTKLISGHVAEKKAISLLVLNITEKEKKNKQKKKKKTRKKKTRANNILP